MRIRRLWLTDFRNYVSAEAELAPDGLTVLVGGNGQGKTNLLEAAGYLATLESFRGAPSEALVRAGCTTAVVRAEGERAGRSVLVEAEINTAGRSRTLLNRQPLRRAADLLGAVRVSLFAPDDLELVKGGPAGRRRYLDDALVGLHPRHAATRSDLDRVLRQRNTLLKQCKGHLDASAATTLDVWDAKLVEAGEALAAARSRLVADLEGPLGKAYDQLAGAPADVAIAYERSWSGPLSEALAATRTDDVRRGLSTVGPHRDDVRLALGGLPARTHASQGEQRCLALALRLAAHRVVSDAVGEPPVLLLDDVFSELDADRSAALVAHLPDGQVLLTTAGDPPPGITPALTLRIHGGRVL
ncbi:MAG TPA: DNA replication/repair protein RecF [Acidimicrobiales bacterium]|nr:DNA replication/repair protein RecF [Acidimicrobiales bacterium]